MRSVIPKNAKLIPGGAKKVFTGIIYDVYHWQQEMFDGSNKTFEMLKRPDTVKTIAIKDNKLVILEQTQPNDGPFYDIPGGRHDNNEEDELDAAKRETLEETGMTFNHWKLIDITQPFIKIDSFVYIFVASEFIEQVEQNLDSGEKIKVLLLSLDDTKLLLDDDSHTRYLPNDILTRVNSIDQILELPQYK